MKQGTGPRLRSFIAAAAIGLIAALTLTIPNADANASTITSTAFTTAHAPTPTGAVCVVAAKAFVQHGNTNVVTATSQTCYSSNAKLLAARAVTPAVSYDLGYGCTLANFNGTCYYFAAPGVCNGRYWFWNNLDAETFNRLVSFEPTGVGGCIRSSVYYAPYLTGANIACVFPTGCPTLEGIAHHDESIIIQP